MEQTQNNETETEFELFVVDGRVIFVHSDVVAQLLSKTFQLKTTRASFVEPTEQGQWSVDVAPILGSAKPNILAVFDTRDAALKFEQQWLSERLKDINDANHVAM